MGSNLSTYDSLVKIILKILLNNYVRNRLQLLYYLKCATKITEKLYIRNIQRELDADHELCTVRRQSGGTLFIKLYSIVHSR